MVTPDISKQYDDIGSDYIAQREQDRKSGIVSPSKAFIIRYLLNPEYSSIVDVGCGDGGDLLDYKAIGFKDISGVDSSQAMVEAAHKLLGERGLVKVATWTSLPYPDNSKDYIVGRSSIHYVDNLNSAYKEAARVLKTGGKLIIVSPHPQKVKATVIHNGREYIQNPIYDGKVTITYPRHEIDDYFSSFFNTLFELEDQEEFTKTTVDGQQEPGQIAFVAHLR